MVAVASGRHQDFHPNQFTDDRSQLIAIIKVTGLFVLNGVVLCYLNNRCSLSLIWYATADPVQKFGTSV